MENSYVTAGFGIFFVIISATIVSTAENGFLTYLAAFIVGWLGVDAIYSAVYRRRSLISRIGPSP
jgi:hypothetical protein